MENPEKQKGASLSGGLLGLVVLIGFVWALYSFIKAPSDVADAESQSAAKNQTATIPDWHSAESMEEVARRIKERLVDELEALGIDASNIVANAKAHPTRLIAGVPEHKRTRMLVLSANDEAVIARRYVEECEKKGFFDDNPDNIARIAAIVERLVAVVPEIDSIPEIHILRDDSVNACCLPDGTVFMNTGTLKAIADDSLLAAIFAHELGHAAARHGNESVTLALMGAAGGVAFEEWLAKVMPIFDSGEGVSLVRFAYGLGGSVGFILPRSRRNELEADRLGVRYLARAGFDPEGAERLFESFKKIDPQKPSVLIPLLSTHPVNDERIEHVRKVLAEPDLYKMPKVGLGSQPKHRADEVDFTKIDLKASVTNAIGRLGKHDRKYVPEGFATNQPPAAKRFKLPWRRKGGDKGRDATESER